MVIAGLEEIKALDNTLAATILHVWYKSTLSLASETKTRIRCSSWKETFGLWLMLSLKWSKVVEGGWLGSHFLSSLERLLHFSKSTCLAHQVAVRGLVSWWLEPITWTEAFLLLNIDASSLFWLEMLWYNRGSTRIRIARLNAWRWTLFKYRIHRLLDHHFSEFNPLLSHFALKLLLLLSNHLYKKDSILNKKPKSRCISLLTNVIVFFIFAAGCKRIIKTKLILYCVIVCAHNA